MPAPKINPYAVAQQQFKRAAVHLVDIPAHIIEYLRYLAVGAAVALPPPHLPHNRRPSL
ncbi:MAG TPA: hypothetical protein VJG32_03090 [Anaerolineae bacterium]|nr:hypothetical protein [Anaerolineae bacterium]